LRIKHGWAFKGEFFSDSGPYVLLTPGNFNEEGGLRLKGEKEKYYTGEVPSEFILKHGDLLVVMTEQAEGLLGSPAIIPEGDRYLHNQRLGLVVDIDESLVDKLFLYYLFNLREVRAQIRATANGAKVRHTSPDRIYQVKVQLPPLPLQQEIASILSAYDDLIENNTRRIKILEEMARAIYREWFVHFRFPGHEKVKLVDSPLGKIPEGWEVKPIGDVIETLGGGTPSTKKPEYWENGDVIWFTPSDLTKSATMFISDSEKKITALGLKESSARMFPAYSVMMTRRATI
jgi:type I restriction enzyme S subunit